MMHRHDDEDAARPLPRDWLPEPASPAEGVEWEAAVRRVVAAAEPKLRRIEGGAATGAAAPAGAAIRAPSPAGAAIRAPSPAWAARLGAWWKPAALLAAATAALMVAIGSPELSRPAPAAADLPLRVLAAEGEPASLWAGLGIEADPVLALLALQARDE